MARYSISQGERRFLQHDYMTHVRLSCQGYVTDTRTASHSLAGRVQVPLHPETYTHM